MVELADPTVIAEPLDALIDRVRACRLCSEHLPLGPRPVLRAAATARILIIGQAPGTKVHASGIPWDDPSGERLRQWMAVGPDTFYDQSRIAIMPMGFCYPGRLAKGGDAPPRPECAPAWHGEIRAHLPAIELTLLVGGHAQGYYLHGGRACSMTETVRNFHDHLPEFLALPHPSWRNTAWLRRNSWFEAEVVAVLRRRIKALL